MHQNKPGNILLKGTDEKQSQMRNSLLQFICPRNGGKEYQE